MAKINCILLIEDDDTINFYNRFLIGELGITDHVEVARNGQEGLDYLAKSQRGEADVPDLILLDINMPVMDGFQFVEAYEQLPEDHKSKILVVMLTTSLHPEDVARAKGHKAIREYFYKPLMREKLTEIMQKYFH